MIRSYNTSQHEDKTESDVEINRIFSLQSDNLQEIKSGTAKDRMYKLRLLQKAILKKRKAIHSVLWEDLKKPAGETELTEIFPVISEIKFTQKNLKSWMADRRVSNTAAMTGAKAYIHQEPKGTVLIISTWNYPFQLVMKPLVSAIAAGNAVCLKPSELSTETSRLIEEIIDEVFEENEVAVFRGGKEVAEKLMEKPFDHVFFTGSSAVGKIIMKQAAEHLSDITLELGGKTPVIVDETADIKEAGKKIAWGKFLNCGQSCIAPDYALVHHSRRFDLLYHLKDYVEQSYTSNGATVQSSPDYPRMINKRHYERVKFLIEEALHDGAAAVFGGDFDEDDLFISPTVLEDVSLGSAIMKEEIFGPVLPVIFYNEIDEALEIIGRKSKPLALYIFSTDTERISHILSHTTAGGTAVNDVLVHNMHPNLPFGGVNQSGIGRYNGYAGFKTFSNTRSVLKEPPKVSRSEHIYPPYTRSSSRLLKFLMKYF